MAIYMNWGNTHPPKLQGSATEPDHAGWIEIASFQWGNPISKQDGSASPGDAIFTIEDALLQNAFFRLNAAGEPSQDVQVDFMDKKNNTTRLFFKDAQVSGVRLNQQGAAVTLSFAKSKWGYSTGPMQQGPPPPNLVGP